MTQSVGDAVKEEDGREEAVAARNLTVRYDDFTALDDATLTVHFGEALGVVGPNGSGKSTLLKTLAGLLTPSSGELCVLGALPTQLAARLDRVRAANRSGGLVVPRNRLGRRRDGALSAAAVLAAVWRARP